MQCHDANNSQGQKEQRGQSWLMGAVPLVALVGVGALLIGIPLGTLLSFGLVLVCPLVHIFMMRGMSHGAHHQPSEPRADPEGVMGPDMRKVGHNGHHETLGPRGDPQGNPEEAVGPNMDEIASKAKRASRILLAIFLGKEVSR